MKYWNKKYYRIAQWDNFYFDAAYLDIFRYWRIEVDHCSIKCVPYYYMYVV